MALKPQDVMVALKLAVLQEQPWAYAKLAEELGMSASEVHASVRRLGTAGLVGAVDLRPIRTNLLEFLVHGVRYVFPPERGAVGRGVPTAHAAPPLVDELGADSTPPVWPDPDGTVRGETLLPLYRSAPHASRRDPNLYRCLALVDALRVGRARDRRLAERHLRRELAIP